MYRCLCGAAFEQPNVIQETDHYGDGISRHMKYLLCPVCGLGEQYFEESTEEGDDDDGPDPDLDGSPGGADL